MYAHRNSILLRPRRQESLKNRENLDSEWEKQRALEELKRQKAQETDAFLRLNRKEVPSEERVQYERQLLQEQQQALSSKATAVIREKQWEHATASEAVRRESEQLNFEYENKQRKREAERATMLENMRIAEQRREAEKSHRRAAHLQERHDLNVRTL
eukprot:PhM_4_TR11138/c0_g1_i1/m.69023